MIRRAALVVLCGVMLPMTARGQEIVSGTVRDIATERPLVGAVVTVGTEKARRSARTDERGIFLIPGVGTGRVTLSVRSLGYEPYAEPLDVVVEQPPVEVKLRRLTALDTVTVHATRQGLFGVVATARDLSPLPTAVLQIVGFGGNKVKVDSAGRFFFPVTAVGTYVVRAKAPGYEAQTVSAILAPNEGVEVSFLLDTAVEEDGKRQEFAWFDFDLRVKVRGSASALVPRSELMRNGDKDLVAAILVAPSFIKKSLQFTSEACVYVDGVGRPGFPLSEIDVREVEAVELYGLTAEKSATLARNWPRNTPCGPTGKPRVTLRSPVVRWVVVWRKP